jgi:hypothetical protein
MAGSLNKKSECNIPVFCLTQLFLCLYDTLLFLDHFTAGDADPAGFLFDQTIVFCLPFGGALGFCFGCC